MFNEDVRSAVLEWQKRHGIADNDPLLASLELWEIYLSHRPQDRPADPPSFLEFRSSLEALDAIAKRISRQMTELQQEIRSPSARDTRDSAGSLGFLIWVATALCAGVLIGKFLL